MAANNKLIEDFSDINDQKGKSIYIIISDGMMIASTNKWDLENHLKKDETISPYVESENMVCIFGLLLNNKELPFKIDAEIMEERNIWLLKNEFEEGIAAEPYDSIREVAKAIEEYMEADLMLEIEDFCILLGEEIKLALCLVESGKAVPETKVYK